MTLRGLAIGVNVIEYDSDWRDDHTSVEGEELSDLVKQIDEKYPLISCLKPQTINQDGNRIAEYVNLIDSTEEKVQNTLTDNNEERRAA